MRRINYFYEIGDIQNIFFSEVGTGISFNSILLLFHILEFLLENRPRTIDLLISLLALIHFGMPMIMEITAADIFASHVNPFVLQAVTLSPRSSYLAKFKHKSPQHSLCSLLVLWVFYMSCGAHFPFSSVADYVTSHGLTSITESCIILPMSSISRRLNSIVRIFWDVSLIGLMVLSSGYMLALLCRHKKQVRHLHSTSLSPKASPEQRATRTILLLLSFFVVMYCLDCILSASRLMHSSDTIYHSIQMMVCNSYATISPLLLICSEK
ncbi:Vom1r90 [Phodopus roborovskii]|uniref:Vomeronasal type-1 receptor n=1 Tax=Phodopus roborovskii TaxID=109678 RepID=A0AAV0A586_PHORO|nr:Vom1r90 [Phodopus roborovskii]